MKFSHLKVGERFLLKGELYVKATPLLANHADTGVNKVVPKYMNIELAETRTADAVVFNKPDEMLEYIVSELSDAINSSTLSDAGIELVHNEIKRIKHEAMKKIK